MLNVEWRGRFLRHSTLNTQRSTFRTRRLGGGTPPGQPPRRRRSLASLRPLLPPRPSLPCHPTWDVFRCTHLLDEPRCLVDDIVEGHRRRLGVLSQSGDVDAEGLGFLAGFRDARAEAGGSFRLIVQIGLQFRDALDVAAEENDVVMARSERTSYEARSETACISMSSVMANPSKPMVSSSSRVKR